MNPYCGSLVYLVFLLEIIPRTISWLENTSRIWVKKYLNVRSIMELYLLQCSLHNLTYLSLLNSFLLLVLSTFPVFLKSLNNYFFRWLAYKSLLAEFYCYIISYNMWSSNLFVCIQHVFGFPHFSWVRFFRVQVFLGLSPGSRSRVWVQVLEVDDAKQL